MGETQENRVTFLQNGRSPHLNYYLQLNTKEDVEGRRSVMGGYLEELLKQG